MPEAYATGTDARGNRVSYRTRGDYLAGRARSSNRVARQRQRINASLR